MMRNLLQRGVVLRIIDVRLNVKVVIKKLSSYLEIRVQGWLLLTFRFVVSMRGLEMVELGVD